MSKRFQLQIPEPCHENWDKMTPVDKGRFCDSCQKAVIDFTGMSDAQLIAFFKKPSTGSVCGRFFDDQLNRDYEIQRKRIPWLKYFFQLTIPVFLGGLKSYSQGKPLLINDKTSICMKTNVIEPVIYGNLMPMKLNKIMGKVTDEKGNGIPYASVNVKGTTQGTSCDSAGIFTINVAAHQKIVDLVVSSIGYFSVEKEIKIKKTDWIEIRLKANAALNGEVVVTSSYGMTTRGKVTGAMSIVRTSYLQKVKDYFTKDSINVFPNPAKAAGEIKIEWKKGNVGDNNIELYNMQGQLIETALVDVDPQTAFINFQLPPVIPGNYILRITNKKAGKSHSEKIIIQ